MNRTVIESSLMSRYHDIRHQAMTVGNIEIGSAVMSDPGHFSPADDHHELSRLQMSG